MIRVSIPQDELMGFGAKTQELIVMSRLRDAGIPVEGLLTFQGVKSGILWKHEDYKNYSIVYEWEMIQ